MLKSKLQILTGTGNRRPSAALTMLTGGLDVHIEPEEPVRMRRHFTARTVYLADAHLDSIDRIIEAWQQVGSRRVTRSAVLRRAVEHLCVAVEADAAKSLTVLEHQ